ncbi:superoxide dismutase [Laspinema olomoucense]|uniref:Superoxide dismutase n=1 Tax=Laspinema olomoucense D3b TaxID=2953688 RepID=A0ABT2N0U2_9CYAN|nr:superoxide dismutase [Laspinema sp. D3b]MCT7976298.1 superoxide dismutase [Laspinema sp. D3b]
MKNKKKWRLGSIVGGFIGVFLLIACQGMGQTNLSQTPATTTSPGTELSASPAELPPLPYPYNALEPHIDAQTMELHHDKHHASYVSNLNKALENNSNLQNQSVEALIRNLNQVPENIRTAVRNNGGGHVNHSMFWEIMSPNGGGEPTGAIAQAINETFGSFKTFQEQFNQAGTSQFGSGWVWLVRNAQGQLEITSTPNQDSPLMDGKYPIMGNDVWEHAYYLNYQNQRGEYLKNWWNVVNWEEVNRRLERASEAS